MIRIKNWQEFQRYKRPNVPWIKLYRALLDDPEWHNLKDSDAKVLVMLWLIASETNDGSLPNISKIAFRLRMKESALESIVSRLAHFIHNDMLGPVASRELEGEGEGEVLRKTKRESETFLDKPKNGDTLGSDFWESIKTNQAYTDIDIDREVGKMHAWLLTPKANGRKLTKGFIVNWLNKIDVPISSSPKPTKPKTKTLPCPKCRSCMTIVPLDFNEDGFLCAKCIGKPPVTTTTSASQSLVDSVAAGMEMGT